MEQAQHSKDQWQCKEARDVKARRAPHATTQYPPENLPDMCLWGLVQPAGWHEATI